MSTTEVSNNCVIFTKSPELIPVINEHFKFVERKTNLSSIELGKDEILVKNLQMSLDPYIRSLMIPSEAKGVTDPFVVGNVMEVPCVSLVIKSNNDQWKEGDLFFGVSGWEEYTKISSEAANKGLYHKPYLKNASDNNIPLSYFLGLLGFPGMSAYAGLFNIGKPKQGETIFVSSAAGAVGQVVGQLAKMKGLKVIGSTGDDSRVNYLLNELKFDHAFNYKKVDINQTLKETCPEGIDIYFDNVGGKMLDVVLEHLNNYARVVACGMSSRFATNTPYGFENLRLIVIKRILIQGFAVTDYFKDFETFQNEMSQWLKEGKLKYKEDVVNGIENSPQAFLTIFNGTKFGKLIVKINDL